MTKAENPNQKASNIVVIILLAGMGSRLGRPHPKSMTPLSSNQTILSRQLSSLRSHGLQICCVVGFKKDLIMEEAADCLFVYNADYDCTNTSKSLLTALKHFKNHNILWLNGDVVFHPLVIDKIIDSAESSVAVNSAKVGEEEIKYSLNQDGYIKQISKQNTEALGEAVGINYITSKWVPEFVEKLEEVEDQAYFERAMELLIQEHGNVFKPLDISDLGCIEVDFEDDLKAAKDLIQNF
jgi:choline kinase